MTEDQFQAFQIELRDRLKEADLSSLSAISRGHAEAIIAAFPYVIKAYSLAMASGDEIAMESARMRLRNVCYSAADLLAVLDLAGRARTSDAISGALETAGKVFDFGVRYAAGIAADSLARAVLKSFSGTAR